MSSARATASVPSRYQPSSVPIGEAVAEVVHARPGMIAGTPSDLGTSAEDMVDLLVQQSSAALRDEEVWAVARPEMRTPLGVAMSAVWVVGCKGTRRDLPNLVNRAVSNARLQVDIVTFKADRFGQKVRHRDQPE